MKISILPFVFSIITITSCSPAETKLSESYQAIQAFLLKAGLDKPELVYFYTGKPRLPLPNVYCFDKSGTQLESPPECFQLITEYIRLLSDSTVPVMKPAENMDSFLVTVPIMNAYNEPVTKAAGEYEFFLFIDFMAIDVESFRETLRNAYNAVLRSKRKIKLFLVHAFSEKNLPLLKKEKWGMPDSTGNTN